MKKFNRGALQKLWSVAYWRNTGSFSTDARQSPALLSLINNSSSRLYTAPGAEEITNNLARTTGESLKIVQHITSYDSCVLEIQGEEGGKRVVRVYHTHSPEGLAGPATGEAVLRPRSALNPTQLFRSLRYHLGTTFLPVGYPGSVGPGYLPFVFWQTIHHMASAANGVLASTFLLYSVGLGAGAIPTAGAINWVLKDGLGQLGSLLFGKTIAHNFDVNTKTWYLMASTKLDTAIGLEICTFLMPQHFLLIGSLANMMKGLAWMAGGSTRSAFNVSFSRDNNIADITAKATSQTICTSLLGTAAGITLCSAIGQNVGWALGAYVTLAAIHLSTAYQCVKGIPLASLNPTRLQLLTDAFISAKLEQATRMPDQAMERGVSLPDPSDIALQEPAICFPSLTRDPRFVPRIQVGGPVTRLSSLEPSVLASVIALFKGEKHVVLPCNGRLEILLRRDASSQDALLAYLQACLMKHYMRQEGTAGEKLELQMLGETLGQARQWFPQFREALEHAGWATDKVTVEARKHRAVW
eukprot:jgi/Botrbrau1/1016/Bobra.114_1s0054.1